MNLRSIAALALLVWRNKELFQLYEGPLAFSCIVFGSLHVIIHIPLPILFYKQIFH
jgi:hypothetical protein